MTHSRTDEPEKAAVRIAEALTRRPVCVEQQLLAADIRLLAGGDAVAQATDAGACRTGQQDGADRRNRLIVTAAIGL